MARQGKQRAMLAPLCHGGRRAAEGGGVLDQRVVVVTGVGPGLGRSLAFAAARHGATVVMVARAHDRLDTYLAEMLAAGLTGAAVAADVTDETACHNVVTTTLERFGRVDGLVNSAFVQPPFATIEDTPMDVWRSSFEVNCHAAVQLTKAALPALKASPYASVVNITTMSIHTTRPRFGAYAAAKAATQSFTRTLAQEVGPYGIRVNAVAPGYIWGEPVRSYLQRQADTRQVPYGVVEAELLEQIPLRRIPHPDRIAETAVFYLSDMAADVTGTMLDVNGGQIMR
jgi:NAD(P)-dependent dehydrogenase (short-subunit alcohol dehydrogenase family)